MKNEKTISNTTSNSTLATILQQASHEQCQNMSIKHDILVARATLVTKQQEFRSLLPSNMNFYAKTALPTEAACYFKKFHLFAYKYNFVTVETKNYILASRKFTSHAAQL